MVTSTRLLTSLLLTLTSCLLASCGHSDCFYSGLAKAWDDNNSNGMLDSGEVPLPGVLISVSGGRAGTLWWQAPTDVKGEALMNFAYSCNSAFEVTAQAPPNSRATTPERVSLASRASGSGPVLFGFTSK